MYRCRSLAYLNSLGYEFICKKSKRISLLYYLDEGELRYDNKKSQAFFKRHLSGRSRFLGFSKKHTKQECSLFDYDMDVKMECEIERNGIHSEYVLQLLRYVAHVALSICLLGVAFLSIIHGIKLETMDLCAPGIFAGIAFNICVLCSAYIYPKDETIFDGMNT